MRDCNVITNGLEEETLDNDVKCIYKEVVIVGNGPSGITLSYLLSGYRPFYNRVPHPDPMLSARLIECTQKSLLQQDLSFLAQGIEGRSKNPISLLVDAMTHPGADMGLEWPSLLTWKKTAKSLDHVVLGKGSPGGTWPGIADHVLTISPGRWMALPGLEFNEYRDKRAPAYAVAKYYLEYIKKHDLTSYMSSQSTVTMIQPLTCKTRKRARWKVWVNDVNGTVSYECRHLVLATGSSDKAGCLGVPGEYLPFVNHDMKHFEEQLLVKESLPVFISPTGTISSIDLSEKFPSPFRRKGVASKNNDILPNDSSGVDFHIVNGSADENSLKSSMVRVQDDDSTTGIKVGVNRLSQVPKAHSKEYFKEENKVNSENPWFVSDIPNDQQVSKSFNALSLNENVKEFEEVEEKKVLVVGAGLSAADAILAAWEKNFTVVHAFRSSLTTSQLPALVYPEYHELYKLMQGASSRKDYQSLPGYQVTEFFKDNTVHLTDSSGNSKILKVHSVAVLIGSQPDLFFLPKTLKNLGVNPDKPIDCKVNPIQIDRYSYRCVRAPPGLYALGPLVGDNFVRFLQGGAVAVAGHIVKDNNLQKLVQ